MRVKYVTVERYAETNDRIAVLGGSPITNALSEVIHRLGRAAGSVGTR